MRTGMVSLHREDAASRPRVGRCRSLSGHRGRGAAPGWLVPSPGGLRDGGWLPTAGKDAVGVWAVGAGGLQSKSTLSRQQIVTDPQNGGRCRGDRPCRVSEASDVKA